MNHGFSAAPRPAALFLTLSAGVLLSACTVTGAPSAAAPAVPSAGDPRGLVLPSATNSVPATSAPTAKPAPAAAPVGVPAAASAAVPTAAAPAPAVAPAPAAAASPPPPIMPFNDAVLFAANNLFGKAALPNEGPGPAGRFPLVIDPLVDGVTGAQSTATRGMEARIVKLVQSQFPRYEVQPFSTTSLARGPLLFIGTFTPVDKDGKGPAGPVQWSSDWYRICLALVDLRTGKIVSKGFARANPEGVDVTPTAFFRDAPAWAPDAATEGYVKTCQGTRVGDPINPAYWDRIVAAALVSDAINSYNEGRYEEALDLYRGVLRTGAGDQLRVHNGIYLTSWKLGKKEDAAQAFARIVDYGLDQKRLGVKFLFRPGSTLFYSDPQVSGPYQIWLKQIGERTARRDACLEISGHTSRTGAEPLNDRLSQLRAQYVKQRLDVDAPPLARKTLAVGKGSKENISGLGTDDARDALDRRVEFKIADCPKV